MYNFTRRVRGTGSRNERCGTHRYAARLFEEDDGACGSLDCGTGARRRHIRVGSLFIAQAGLRIWMNQGKRGANQYRANVSGPSSAYLLTVESCLIVMIPGYGEDHDDDDTATSAPA